jgi:hypothetical protein
MVLRNKFFLFIFFVLHSSIVFSEDQQYASYHCIFDDHLDNHQTIASSTIRILLDTNKPSSRFSIPISPENLPGHNYNFTILYQGKKGKLGFPDQDMFEVSLFDVEKQVTSSNVGTQFDDLYTSFTNDEDKTQIYVYCSKREFKPRNFPWFW